MISRLTDTLDFNATALRLRAERTQVLASNLANADTPNYQARDFDFSQALSAATGAREGGGGAATAAGRVTLAMDRTSGGHLPGASGADFSPTLAYRNPMQTALDANTVDADMERAHFADNTLRFEASLRFINSQIKTLQSAINGTPAA
jgi:flagellar basal-body rod protein FlgB